MMKVNPDWWYREQWIREYNHFRHFSAMWRTAIFPEYEKACKQEADSSRMMMKFYARTLHEEKVS
jgi:hypothetical protein